MSGLTEVRSDLATLLDGVLAAPVFSELPEKVAPPFTVVGPGDPYISFEGAPFGACQVHLAATFVSERGTNDVRAADLDAAILAIVAAITEDARFMVVQVEQPGSVSINNQSHLAVSVTILTEVEL